MFQAGKVFSNRAVPCAGDHGDDHRYMSHKRLPFLREQ